MYRLFIANKNYSSWSLRPWVLMKQLKIPFAEQLVPFGEARFETFSPTGLVPCLFDRDLAIWDSLAITEYLAERHDTVWPKNNYARAWARCAAAEMHSGFLALRTRCPMNLGIRMRLHEKADSVDRDLSRIDKLWSEGLERHGGPFLAGEVFTAVDAFYAPVAFRLKTYGIDLSETSNAYAGRLCGLDSMRAWFASALAEPWRDLPHEEEALASGVLLDDLRLPPVRPTI
jgi:glutathione S-transferase